MYCLNSRSLLNINVLSTVKFQVKKLIYDSQRMNEIQKETKIQSHELLNKLNEYLNRNKEKSCQVSNKTNRFNIKSCK